MFWVILLCHGASKSREENNLNVYNKCSLFLPCLSVFLFPFPSPSVKSNTAVHGLFSQRLQAMFEP